MAIHLNSSVSELPGIGTKAAKDLKNMNIRSVHELLLRVPYRYDDFSVTKPISEIRAGDTLTVHATIQSIDSRSASRNRKMKIIEAVISDESGELKVVWFNQEYLMHTLRPGMKVSLAGKVDGKFGLSLVNPVYEKFGSNIHTGRMVPVYSLSGSLTIKRLRGAIKSSLSCISEIVDWVPDEILLSENYPSLADAILGIHFPDTKKQLFSSIDRLKFDELFLHQLMFARVRNDREKQSCYSISINKESLRIFVNNLPFKLTGAQRQSVWDIISDMAEGQPMNRLLEGDVGSGKTVVAAMSASAVLDEGLCVLYLAPTEILASQQYEAMNKFITKHNTALLTRSMSKFQGESIKQDVLIEKIKSGEIISVVGTHKILREDLSGINLGMVVIDEQHRFGVEQRHALLQTKDKPAPHLLSMTATPIPRSLALTFYGDLELSVLDEMPKGRIPIGTAVVPESHILGMYDHICTEIENGRQVYVVCPLIDPSDNFGARSVVEISKEIKKSVLNKFKSEVLHGKLASKDKEKIITDFKNGKIDILISTTVIEVGVDVPNATVMVIVNAERFGLAQLHQLRGRVGRSVMQSYCYLLPGDVTENSMERLRVLESTNDGFEVAEKDLLLRGPGNIFGNAQSGLPDFKLATINDFDLMKNAKKHTEQILNIGIDQFPLVENKINITFEKIHLE